MKAAAMSVAVAAALAALVLSACNILGPASYIALGPEAVPARHELLDRPTVVFVDDRANAIPMNAPNTRRAIADRVTEELLKREVVTQMINPADAMSYARRRDRDDDLMPIDELGRAVGAEQVIYVELDSFKGSPDGVQARMLSACRVKVIDAVAKVRLSPPPDHELGWWEVKTMSGIMNPDQYRTERGRRDLQAILAELTGDDIARVFYKHAPGEVGTRLQQR